MSNIYFIAEVGVNHEGDFDSAIEYCKQAKNAGADAVKFQWVDAERAYAKNTESYQIFKNAYFSFKQMKDIYKYCNYLKIDFFATPGDMETLFQLAEINNKIVKISSGLSTHRFMIREASKLFKELIISTGTLSLSEIIDLNRFLAKLSCKYSFLKCTSQYPSIDSNLNLDAISFLNSKFKVDIGYSCHSLESLPCITAVAMGAKIIEKHFSIDTSRKGFDHALSFNFDQTKLLIDQLRKVENIKKWSGLLPSEAELIAREKMHRFMISKKDLEVGYKINLSDFNYMRIEQSDISKFVPSISSLEFENCLLIKPCKKNQPLLKEYIQQK